MQSPISAKAGEVTIIMIAALKSSFFMTVLSPRPDEGFKFMGRSTGCCVPARTRPEYERFLHRGEIRLSLPGQPDTCKKLRSLLSRPVKL
jgi:hypothetical protein